MVKCSRNESVSKRIVGGAVGGLAASFAMNQFQRAWSAVQQRLRANGENDAGHRSEQSDEETEPATVKTAQAISKKFWGHELTDGEKKLAGPAVHYAFGTANGMLYGMLSTYLPKVRLGRGTLFGIGLWTVADELAVPALGLSMPPTQYPISTQVYGLASHIVYGLTTDAISRAIRALF